MKSYRDYSHNREVPKVRAQGVHSGYKCDMTPGKYICDSVSAAQEYKLMPGYVEFLGMLKNRYINRMNKNIPCWKRRE